MRMFLGDLAQPAINIALGFPGRLQCPPLKPSLYNRARHRLRFLKSMRAFVTTSSIPDFDDLETLGIAVDVPLKPRHASSEQLAPLRPPGWLVRAQATGPTFNACRTAFMVILRIRRLFFTHICLATISKGNSGVRCGLGSQRMPADRALSLTPHEHKTRVLAPSCSVPHSAHR